MTLRFEQKSFVFSLLQVESLLISDTEQQIILNVL